MFFLSNSVYTSSLFLFLFDKSKLHLFLYFLHIIERKSTYTQQRQHEQLTD